ncbi:MAG: tryptophan--tRNA ligase [Candidatus Thermoplasmatota archaeon]
MKIDPWSSSTYQDYTKLRDEFGIEEFKPEFLEKLPDTHKLFRRGVIIGHRDFGRIHRAIQEEKKWTVLTGLMPSGRMHLGHKMVIDEVIYYQRLGAEIAIAVADIEAYATRGYTLEETREFALNEYIPNYIALGLKPDRCRIYFQSENQDVKDLGYLLGKKINWSQMQATYGFEDSTNMTHIFSPLIQTGDILHVQLEKHDGVKPTLVPVGVDQDPHLRLCRDIAKAHRLFNVMETKDGKIGVFVKVDENVEELLDAAEKTLQEIGYKELKRITKYKAIYLKNASIKDVKWIDEKLAFLERKQFESYGFIPPSATFHRFMTGLTGEKMSSSKPETAIFLSDSGGEVKEKIMQAKTGGAVSLQEHKKHGGRPDECVIYELFLYHLLEDDEKLAEIYKECTNGNQTCGMCKKKAVKLIQKFLQDLRKKREKAKKNVDRYLK